jgi:anthranilate synthase/aminodeoxychorismate synthase-like glutamine amidotransferase
LKILLLDNYDSFTHTLKDYFEQRGAKCMVFRNDKITVSEIELLAFDAIVISPGPKRPKDAGIVMELIATCYKTKPILGVCLGHQAIAEYFGGILNKATLPRHGKVDMVKHNGDEMFKNIPESFKATRYHSLIINNLPSELIETASCNNELMAFRHKNLPIWGVQFHPESCETQLGLQTIRNFIDMVTKIHSNN